MGKIRNERYMTGMEYRIYKGIKASSGDKAKEENMLKNEMQKILGMEVEDELPSGEIVNIPLMEKLAMSKIAYDLEHPEKIDLKMYSSVLGESKVELEAKVTTANDLFGDIVVGNKEESESK